MAANDGVCGPILLITDLSPRCDRAMDRAAALAGYHNVPLIALHVIDTPWLAKLAKPDWRNEQQARLDAATKQLRKDLSHAQVDVEVLVETGDAIEVIDKTAQSRHCSLIVCGTAREETLGRLVLGNTVEQLARRTTAPLLVVRVRPFAPYARVVVATDFSEGSRHALRAAHNLSPSAQITLYHAFEQVAGIYELDQPSVAEEIAILTKRAKTFGQSTSGLGDVDLPAIVEHGTPEHLLPAHAQANDIELVVMGTHGATGMVRTAMGSVAEKLLSSLRCDVLVVPQTTR